MFSITENKHRKTSFGMVKTPQFNINLADQNRNKQTTNKEKSKN
jgi:hypothetical protein